MTTSKTAEVGLVADQVSLGYGSTVVCSDLNVTIPVGGFTVIVGPNACGKSTLLKAFARLIKPTTGQVRLAGKTVDSYRPREYAKRVGLLPQTAIAPDGITVADLVRRGRSPHHTMLSQWSQQDQDAVTAALATTSISHLSGRLVHQLSGGQRQRVWVAMLLAQQTDILLLDEPTTYLDITHQYGVLNLAEQVRVEAGRTVVAVLHDLNQACRYATHLMIMQSGDVVASGPPAEVVSAELLSEVYKLPCVLTPDPETGTHLVVPRK